MKTYGKPGENPYTNEEIEAGHHWVTTDITCPHCGKEQTIPATGYVGGPCVRCGKKTIGD
jgi:predicted RNA-binding Zn-ribbon protein involved in translation (DUF1610 family)